MAYSSVGLSPDGSSTWYLPRLLGLRRAQELMFTNRRLSAQEALEWGLVHKLAPASSTLDEAMHWAESLASGASASHASIRRLLLASWGNGLETQMELEGRSIAACAAGAEGREGVAAFAQKRKPKF
jgi:2-(1,2-epoxy-1,2-dihydrophenyl)acetyl-CoA isomerase